MDLTVVPTLPRSRQGCPVLFQAGDSPGGRDLAARHADVVFSANTEYDKAVAYATDIRSRLAAYGRSPDSLRILPGASVIVGATAAEATERAEWLRREQLTLQRAIGFLEQYWGKDLSAYDPHGPSPTSNPTRASWTRPEAPSPSPTAPANSTASAPGANWPRPRTSPSTASSWPSTPKTAPSPAPPPK